MMRVIRYIHQNPVKAGMVSRPFDYEWSSCLGYYEQDYFPEGLLESEFVLKYFSDNRVAALRRFKEFNERKNEDKCLEDMVRESAKVRDEAAREEIKGVIGDLTIAQIKSLPRDERKEVLRKVKKLGGVSMRQAARILGVSPNLLFKA
ncbi:hypothetical protein ACERII_12775 [Evansella sp. AB-rgal1]|uniref:hypothetical protein n=1 Tax=Evansella sp. AB-rgal1 TaxID=3242696 RepID=UPI00359D5325